MVKSIEPTEKEIYLPVPGEEDIIVQLTAPAEGVKRSGYAVVLGPGGTGDENLPHLKAIAHEVAKAGHFCARYHTTVPNMAIRVALCTRTMEQLFHPSKGQYPMEKGCFIGGHSLGTRVASIVAARFYNKELIDITAEFPSNFIRGLIVCSYPLHGPDSSTAHRDPTLLGIPAHLPVFMVSGLEDPMCDPTVFTKAIENMVASPRHIVQIEGAEHGMNFGEDETATAKKVAAIAAIGQWAAQFVDNVVAGESEEVQTRDVVITRRRVALTTAEVEGEYTVEVTLL